MLAPISAQPVNFVLEWGSSGSGDGQFDFPHGVAVDSSGNVYVTEINNDRLGVLFTDARDVEGGEE